MKRQEQEQAERILEQLYNTAQRLSDNQLFKQHINDHVATLMRCIDQNKSLVSALVTSLIKKIQSPAQDIRLHRTDFEGGYSARTLDTIVTTPFFKRYFSSYANKESAFLTLATRERIAWRLDEGQALKIRDKTLKQTFLKILDDVESGRDTAEHYLLAILLALSQRTNAESRAFSQALTAPQTGTVTIHTVLKMLQEHFSMPRSSRLPVIAIFTAYQLLMPNVRRYNTKSLRPLNTHTSSDRKGWGDIEILDSNGKPDEIVEVKHRIAIDRYMIMDIVKKTLRTSISRYYVLTTSEPNFASHDEEEFVQQYILQIKAEQGIEIIPNGIVASLKYYLRFVDNYNQFLQTYTKNLVTDAQHSTEVGVHHIQVWQTLSSSYQKVIR